MGLVIRGSDSDRRIRGIPHPPLRVTNRREVESRNSGLESSEARQKFAGAKAISSDMFFGREVDAEVSSVVQPEPGGGRSGKSFLLPIALGFSTRVSRPGQKIPRPFPFFTAA